MKRGALVLFLGLVACSDDDEPFAIEAGASDALATDAGADAAIEAPPDLAPGALPAACAGDTTVPPRSLACTGLYSAIEGKEIALGVAGFTPAVPLWSDGAEKHRWIYLPPGTAIDNSDPNEWNFPIGTKLWKEFEHGGKRIETRLWQKVRDRFWVKATYAWNRDETAALISPGGDIPLDDGSTYHIPTQDECQQCHRGRRENILGFEEVSLGLPGASGLILSELVARNLLTAPVAAAALALGDDGTGAGVAALSWLHVNCGVSCHSSNSNALAYSAGMHLRLDPRTLDGRSAADFGPLRTTVNVPAKNPNWQGEPRIVPGAPEKSLLYRLISMRGIANQMPPIASNLIDETNVAIIADWIRKLPPGKVDAAPPAMEEDAGVDAPVSEDAGADAPDAGADADAS